MGITENTTAADLDALIADARRLQYVASSTGDAPAVFRLEDTLLDLYRRRDALVARG